MKKIAVEKNRLNLCSYVLLITYKDFKFVLAGDAEKESWDYIVENYSDKISNVNVLKAAHHGRESGFHEEAVKLMNPEYTVVSVGKNQTLMPITSIRNIQGKKFYLQDTEET